MAATQAELREWFDTHKRTGFDYMLVYVDEFDWSDYPVGLYAQSYWVGRHELNARGMQRFMESYDLHADRDEQLRVARVDRFPVEPPLHSPEIPVRVKTTKGERTMELRELYRKNGLNLNQNQGLSKLLSIFDERLDALSDRADTIDKQIEPLYKAVILNSPAMRDEIVKRVMQHIGVDTSRGVPPTDPKQPMNAYDTAVSPPVVGDAPRGPATAQSLNDSDNDSDNDSERRVYMGGPEKPSVLAFKCRMCTELTDSAKRVRIEGHHNIFVCPQCAGKLSDIISALLS